MNILNEIKSTLIGLAMIGAALYVYIERDEIVSTIGLASLGIALMFGKDTVINLIIEKAKKLLQ